jgi:hypothetical protein
MVDGLCDYGSHTVVYLMLGWWLQQHVSAWCWIAVVGAGLSRIVQANHYEVQRRQYQWWAYGNPWLRQDDVPITGPGTALARFTCCSGGHWRPAEQRWTRPMTGWWPTLRRPRRPQHCPRACRRSSAQMAHPGCQQPHHPAWAGHAGGIAAYYFLFEAIALNAVLLASITHAAAPRAPSQRSDGGNTDYLMAPSHRDRALQESDEPSSYLQQERSMAVIM